MRLLQSSLETGAFVALKDVCSWSSNTIMQVEVHGPSLDATSLIAMFLVWAY
jgi:hypothetical protein